MTGKCILVGVFPGQHPAVAREAARLAAALRMPLIAAYVNESRVPVKESDDGSVTSLPLDPDSPDDGGTRFPAQLATAVGAQIALLEGGRMSAETRPETAAGPSSGSTAPAASPTLPWRTVLLAGDPATALIHCAHTLDAAMIVVGTHGTHQTPLHVVFRHSVATKVARQQDCPVLVVPTHLDRAGSTATESMGPDQA